MLEATLRLLLGLFQGALARLLLRALGFLEGETFIDGRVVNFTLLDRVFYLGHQVVVLPARCLLVVLVVKLLLVAVMRAGLLDQAEVEVPRNIPTVLIKGTDGARVTDWLVNFEVIVADLASIG